MEILLRVTRKLVGNSRIFNYKCMFIYSIVCHLYETTVFLARFPRVVSALIPANFCVIIHPQIEQGKKQEEKA